MTVVSAVIAHILTYLIYFRTHTHPLESDGLVGEAMFAQEQNHPWELGRENGDSRVIVLRRVKYILITVCVPGTHRAECGLDCDKVDTLAILHFVQKLALFRRKILFVSLSVRFRLG